MAYNIPEFYTVKLDKPLPDKKDTITRKNSVKSLFTPSLAAATQSIKGLIRFKTDICSSGIIGDECSNLHTVNHFIQDKEKEYDKKGRVINTLEYQVLCRTASAS
jgi:hypothetical protein